MFRTWDDLIPYRKILPVPPLAAWIVASRQAGRARDRTPPPGSASFAIQPTSPA